jgi:hypothetical protein
MSFATDAYEDVIAEAIAGELNDADRDWNDLFDAELTTAVRTRAPLVKTGTELNTLKVFVIPLRINPYTSGRQTHRIARDRRAFSYEVLLNLLRSVDPDDDERLKWFSKMAEQIHDFFDDGHELTGVENWICMEADRREVFDQDLLYKNQIWGTAISINVVGYRA